jgi:ketosteroid isomerase-like protein
VPGVLKIRRIEFVQTTVATAQTTGSTCNLICMETEDCPPSSTAGLDGTRTLGRRLVDAFGSGWAQANLDLLMSVYTPDVVFIETPFSTALHGHDAVRRYWADVPYNQSEVTFTSGEIFAAGPWFSTEFKCRFRRRRTGEWVEARGAIFCETAGDRISEMRMYWHRWNGGRETGKP